MATFQPGAPQSLISTQLVTLRASAVLALLSAYDAAPTEVACPSFTRLTLLCSYTRDAKAVAGAVTMRLEFSPTSVTGAGTWYRVTELAAGAFVAGADVANLIQRSVTTYTSTAGPVERWIWDLEIPTAMERVRIACAETGTPLTPGTVEILGLLSV